MDYSIEKELESKGYKFICGVDEAGRGPLAGPVYAAAVILPMGLVIDGLNDSKKLTERKRDALFDIIIKNAVSYSISFATVEEIESVNILNAAQLAMRRAVDGLNVKSDFALIDGNISRGFTIPTQTVVKGDALSPSIASASILAKVSRDRYCVELDKKYPGYGFAKHKGYGTKAHYEAIKSLGPCEAHRLSFLKNVL